MLGCSLRLQMAAVGKVCQPAQHLPLLQHYKSSSLGHHCATAPQCHGQKCSCWNPAEMPKPTSGQGLTAEPLQASPATKPLG